VIRGIEVRIGGSGGPSGSAFGVECIAVVRGGTAGENGTRTPPSIVKRTGE
jgi:hypothetical protein